MRSFSWIINGHVKNFIIGFGITFLCAGISYAESFDPSNITGLKMWLKTDGITASDGDPIASWDDSSTQNNDADQGTATHKPTFKTNLSEFNYKSVVRFDGNDFLETANNLTFGDFTVCVVFGDDESVGENARLLDHDYTNGFWLGRHDIYHDYWGSGVKESTAPYGRFVKLDDTHPHCLCSVRDGSTHTIYGDGYLIESATVASSTTSSNPLALGQRVDTGDDQYFSGDIAEVVVYDNAISDGDMADLEEYFESRFRIPFSNLGKLAKLTPRAKAPTCNSKREGGLIHLSSDKRLYHCDGTDWNRIAYAGTLGEKSAADLTTGQTFSTTSSIQSGVIGNAFDDDTGTNVNFSAASSYPYVKVEMDQARVVNDVRISVEGAEGRADNVSFAIEASHDDSNWTSLYSDTGYNFKDGKEFDLIEFSNTTAYTYYRVKWSSSNNGSGLPTWYETEMYDDFYGQDVTFGQTYTHDNPISSGEISDAFDDDIGESVNFNSTDSYPSYITVQMSEPKTVTEVRINVAGGELRAQGVSFTIDGSNDNSDWTTLKSVADSSLKCNS